MAYDFPYDPCGGLPGGCHLTDDMREVVQAMMEKRPPRFKDEY